MAQQAIQRATQPASVVALQVFGEERLQILKDTIAKDLSNAELDVFAMICQRSKLDPFTRPPQIYPVKFAGQLQVIAGVDSFRLAAARTREYAGQVGPFWCGPDGEWKDLWLSKEPPAAARVGVWRKGFREPVWSVATWQESAKSFNGQLGDFWKRMPAQMLAKCAEVNALKRAFPNDTEGIELALIDEEIRQQAPANAAAYKRIFGTDEDRDEDGIPPGRALHDGRTIEMTTGEVVEDRADGGAHLPSPSAGQADEGDAVVTSRTAPLPGTETPCVTCGKPIKDQLGNPVNDNQRQLLLQRFGKLECRTCRELP